MAAQIDTEGNIALNYYLEAVAATQPLTREEEIELPPSIRRGDKEARDRLVTANLRFVIRIARQYQGLGVNIVDLIGAGNLGLLAAAERFDETKGFKFISYAVWWIRQAIFQLLAEQSRAFRISMGRRDLMAAMIKFSRKHAQQCGTPPSMEEIAVGLGVEERRVIDTFKLHQPAVSLDAPIAEDGAATFSCLIVDESQPRPDEAINRLKRERQILNMLESLRPREAEIVRLYFGLDGQEPQTLEQIGERLDLTRERVRQIKKKALSCLRRLFQREEFFENLG